MAQIKIEPGDVSSKGGDFKRKSTEVQELVNSGKQLMSALESTFTGNRANRIQNEWRSFQPRLTAAIEALSETGDFLKRAAQSFSDTDNAGL